MSLPTSVIAGGAPLHEPGAGVGAAADAGARAPSGRRRATTRGVRGFFGALGIAQWVAVGFLVLLLVAAFFPALLARGDPLAIDPGDAFQAPGWGHPFGTDESGRDVYTRVVHGTAPSLVIGVSATAIGILLALVLGTAAALGGRLVDFGVSRFLEVLFAFPGLLLALLVITVYGPGIVTSTIAVGLATAPGYARIIRSQTRAVASSAYVEAAVVLGTSRGRILARHILPNAVAPVFVLVTLGVGQAIVWAAALSYLGLGAEPPAAEWGAMLFAGKNYVTTAWWMTFFPGLAIVLSAAATTVLGRALQRRGAR
ncbi:ABC transporter permease [Herbiconiux sp. P17]|uniref:ABC transporter permease n=1 Tax=Herbiconiux wuyangfengii TaxID=3342794 RepID=UPI0035B8B62C